MRSGNVQRARIVLVLAWARRRALGAWSKRRRRTTIVTAIATAIPTASATASATAIATVIATAITATTSHSVRCR
jgi:hypothetical protein